MATNVAEIDKKKNIRTLKAKYLFHYLHAS